jgi:hypothetical protein
LTTSRGAPFAPNGKGEMLVNGPPGTLIIGGGKPSVILPGKVLASSLQRVGFSRVAKAAPIAQ